MPHIRLWGAPARACLLSSARSWRAGGRYLRLGHLRGLHAQLLAPAKLDEAPTVLRPRALQQLVVQPLAPHELQLLHEGARGEPAARLLGRGFGPRAHEDPALVAAADDLPDLGGASWLAQKLIDEGRCLCVCSKEGMTPVKVQPRFALANALDHLLHDVGGRDVVLLTPAHQDGHLQVGNRVPCVMRLPRLELPRDTLHAEGLIDTHLLISGEQCVDHLPARWILLLPLLSPVRICLKDLLHHPVFRGDAVRIPVVDRKGHASGAPCGAAAEHELLDEVGVAEGEVLRHHASKGCTNDVYRQLVGQHGLQQGRRVVRVVRHGAGLVLDGRLAGVSVVVRDDLEQAHQLADVLRVRRLPQVGS
mmetsp:Transcript_16165/g.33674  ORF Transcript_16165/g.33674 Transcript_16165/m.33674 type:complete len:363 (+) Transcript_16165:119-1207(+)